MTKYSFAQKALCLLVIWILLDYLGGYSVGFLPIGPATAQAQQGFPLISGLTSTTLAAQVCGGDLFTNANFCSGPTPDTFVTLASVSGLNPAINGAVQSYMYIDRELFGVLNVNTTTKQVTVLRGQWGTAVHSHANGELVLFGQANAFMSQDPSGACTSANVLSQPWVNVVTGYQWLCSTINTQWVPGFGNPGNSADPIQPTAAVASATTITPSGPLFHLTGTTAVTTITAPLGFNNSAVGGGSFCLIADGVGSLGTGGNLEVGVAVTTAVGKEYCLQWDPVQSKYVVLGS